MKFHYKGDFDGNEEALPMRLHPEGSVPFNEPENMESLAKIANLGAVILIIILAIPVFFMGRHYLLDNTIQVGLGFVIPMLTLYPHELIHGICFKEDVYMYTNFKQGILFVIGTEDMSKTRFIFMSMLPNMVFGIIPYIVFLINPQLIGCGIFATLCIGMGFGDYMNVYNALTQMPRGAVTYISGMHSYWYIANK